METSTPLISTTFWLRTLLVAVTVAMLPTVMAEAERHARLKLEVEGCAVVAGRVCHRQDMARLSLWVEHALSDALSTTANGVRLEPVERERLGSGSRLTFELSESAPEDAVTRLEFQAGSRQALLELTGYRPPDRLLQAITFYREGQLDAAERALRALSESVDKDWQGVVHRRLGQTLTAQNSGVPTVEAQTVWANGVKHDRAASRNTHALRTATMLVYALLQEGSFERAREQLDAFSSHTFYDADSLYNFNYFKGLLAYNTGNARDALRYFDRASLHASRARNSRWQAYADILLSLQMQRTGRYQAAARRLSPWLKRTPEDLPPCDRSLVSTNIVWSGLLLAEAGEPLPDVSAEADAAHRLAREHCGPREQANALTNLSLFHLHRGDLDRARDFASQAWSIDERQMQIDVWLLDIDARIALSEGAYEAALARYAELEELATAGLLAAAKWRALRGKGRVRVASGDLQQALRHYQAADALLKENVLQVPVDQGREALLSARSVATQEHLALLLRMEQFEDAFSLARETRTRALAGVRTGRRLESLTPRLRALWDQFMGRYQVVRKELEDSLRNSWTLPADALAELEAENRQRRATLRSLIDTAMQATDLGAPVQLATLKSGELVVLPSKIHKRWVVFAHNGTSLRVHETPCSSQHDLATDMLNCLLLPLKADLRAATSLRWLAPATLAHLDVQTSTVLGKPLVHTLPVTYAMDIGDAPARQSLRGRALLVADGAGDLTAAHRELEAISRQLEAQRSWNIDAVSQSRAVRETLRSGLAESELFHFAGHARFHGEFGWDSALSLTDDTQFSVADILTLARAPDLVVLSGCNTARTTDSVSAQSMGLANAFALAGSRHTVATSRQVDDQHAYALVTRFYSHWLEGKPPQVALQKAQIDLLTTTPEADWSAYRIVSL